MSPRRPYRAAMATALLTASTLTVNPAWSQTYPSRPIQLIDGYAEGGTGYEVGRLLAEELMTSLGQPVTLVQRPGASGVIAAQSVVKAPPDGYTLLVGHPAEIAINQHLVKDLGYRPERDLQPVALAAEVPLALTVRADAPYNSVAELIKAAKSAKQGLSFASSGAGTPSRFAAELLRLRTDARLRHVLYEGAGPALQDLVEGRVDMYFAGIPAAMPYVKSGKLKLLAVSSSKRSPALPDVPTIAETGIKGFDVTLWVGIFAPRTTPTVVVSRLNTDISGVLRKPQVKTRLEALGADVTPRSVAETSAFVKAETGKYFVLMRDEFCSRGVLGVCDGFAALVW
jgi:tripartite-type tricarboxylate transporter receptor subunit TctC